MAKAKALLAFSANIIKSKVVDFTATRFWNLVDVGSPTACWPFTGSPSKNGYGCFTESRDAAGKRKNVRAHRKANELALGPIPKGVQVLHTCGNKLCCNPNHHYHGNPKLNSADARAAGALRGPRLDPTKARAIVLLSNQKVRQVDIGARYGVSVQTINNVVNGRSYGEHTQDLRSKKPAKRHTAKSRSERVEAVA